MRDKPTIERTLAKGNRSRKHQESSQNLIAGASYHVAAKNLHVVAEKRQKIK